MNFKVHLIACGGIAMIMLDIKDSTKDNELPCSKLRGINRKLS